MRESSGGGNWALRRSIVSVKGGAFRHDSTSPPTSRGRAIVHVVSSHSRTLCTRQEGPIKLSPHAPAKPEL